MTVGEDGRIQTSTDGLTWTTQTSGTTEDLHEYHIQLWC